MLYALCHMNVRSTKSCSLPAPGRHSVALRIRSSSSYRVISEEQTTCAHSSQHIHNLQTVPCMTCVRAERLSLVLCAQPCMRTWLPTALGCTLLGAMKRTMTTFRHRGPRAARTGRWFLSRRSLTASIMRDGSLAYDVEFGQRT